MDEPEGPVQGMSPASSLGRRERQVLLAVLAVLAVAIVVAAANVLTGLGGARTAELVRGWGASFVYMLVAAVVAWRAIRVRSNRAAWLLLAIGLTLYGAGNVLWSVAYDSLAAPPFPSISDGLWLALYPTCYVGLVLLARNAERGVAAGVWLDGIVAGLGFAAVGAALVFGPVLASATGSPAAVVTNLAYPIADLLLAALVIGLLALRGWRLDRTWSLLGGGFLLLYVADSMYLLRVAQGAVQASLVPNLFYLSAVVLLAFAAWQPERVTRAVRTERWSVLVVPAASIVAAIGVMLYDHFDRVDGFALTLATLTLVAATLRTALTFRDVRSLAASRRDAVTDDLTALPNRRLFMRTAEEGLEHARESGTGLALLIADLDGFKKLNDTLGHDAGDQLLRQIGPRLAPLLRQPDMLARLGGDEFGIIVRSAEGPAAALSIADRIIEALRLPFDVEGLQLHVTASIGIALFPEHSSDPHQLLRHADIALYQAKLDRSGRELYASSRDTNTRDSLALASELPGAIATGELLVFFQPKAETGGGRVVGMEALVRWEHPRRGLLVPAQFIDLAEQAGVMRDLTRAVLSGALAACRRWRDAGHDLHVAVNVSFNDLMDAEFPLEVATALAVHDVEPEALVLEVTESQLMSDVERIGNVLARLSEFGVRISLDDFGTGFSSLSHLRALPVREVKVDRSFVARMRSDPMDAAIVRSTIQLAHNLGMSVVAEGVEDYETWADLRPLGCDVIQGYVLSRPLAPGAADAFVSDNDANHAHQD